MKLYTKCLLTTGFCWWGAMPIIWLGYVDLARAISTAGIVYFVGFLSTFLFGGRAR